MRLFVGNVLVSIEHSLITLMGFETNYLLQPTAYFKLWLQELKQVHAGPCSFRYKLTAFGPIWAYHKKKTKRKKVITRELFGPGHVFFKVLWKLIGD